MMAKFALVLLMEVLVILPIILGTPFHGHDSYKQYYNNRVNGGRLKPRTAASYKMMMTEKAHYDPNKDNRKHTKDSFNFADVPNCEHLKQTFCEDVPNYPQDYVNRMLAKNSSLLLYSFQDLIEPARRIDNFEAEVCPSAERLILPRTTLNLKNESLYILQSDESNFLQRVRIEVCTELGAKYKIIDGITAGYVTACKENYIYRELSAVSKNGEIIRDYFRFPVSCHIQLDVDKTK